MTQTTPAPPTPAPEPSRVPAASGAGLIGSVLASVSFAALFLVPGLLTGLDPFATTGWRVIAALPFLALVLLVLRQGSHLRDLLRRIGRRPSLLGVVAIDGALFGLQLYLFAWGPLTGNALSVSLGYFLLPLVLVPLGVLVYGERISWARGVAVALAFVGVMIAVITGASVSWATFAVAFGYPAYFMLRRRFRVDTPSALLLEVAVLVPAAAACVVRPEPLEALLGTQANWIGVGVLGLLTAVGFSAYTVAQRSLPMGLFGMLSYLEPILLVVVSVAILAEPLSARDVLSYGAIGAAILVLAIDGLPAPAPARRRTRRVRPARGFERAGAGTASGSRDRVECGV